MPLLTKNSFLFMFDPHRTRYNDRRYFTKKGQIIQAKKVNPPFSIENDKIEAYKNYLIKNHLVETIGTVPIVDGVRWSEDPTTIYRIEELPISEGFAVQRYCQILVLRVNPSNPNYYTIVLVIVIPSSSPYYWISSGSRYLIVNGNDTWNDTFSLMSGSKPMIEFQQVAHTTSSGSNITDTNTVSKDIIAIKGLPA